MRRKKKTQKELIKLAARAYADLHIFAAVIAMMESYLVSSETFTAEARIVVICKAEEQKCLRRYDRALAALAKIPTPPEGSHDR
jgi:hypothetical protein